MPNLFRGLGFSGLHSLLGGGDDWRVPSKSERLGVAVSTGALQRVLQLMQESICWPGWFPKNFQDWSMRAPPQQLGKLYALSQHLEAVFAEGAGDMEVMMSPPVVSASVRKSPF